MTVLPETVIEGVSFAAGDPVPQAEGGVAGANIEATGLSGRRAVREGETLFSLSMRAAEGFDGRIFREAGGIVAATFSSENRFPSLAVRMASALGIPSSAPAFDIQMACSAYPYAVYVASKISADTGKSVVVVDGDVQSRLTDPSDPGTSQIFSDASTVSIVKSSGRGESRFAFLSRYSEALSCPSAGPVAMDGFGVFSFVAVEVSGFLKDFIAASPGADEAVFVPHQANMYMVRRLAKSLGLEGRMLETGGEYANPGSASIPLTLAKKARSGLHLLAGFGAGLSASAALVRYEGR